MILFYFSYKSHFGKPDNFDAKKLEKKNYVR